MLDSVVDEIYLMGLWGFGDVLGGWRYVWSQVGKNRMWIVYEKKGRKERKGSE